MIKYLFILTTGTVLLLTGCSSVDTREVKNPRQELADPWSEADSFTQTENVSKTSRLPLKKISPRNKSSFQRGDMIRVLRRAASTGNAKACQLLDQCEQNPENLDEIICQVLETAALYRMKSPLHENYVKAGIEKVAGLSARHEYNFSQPAPQVLRAARADKNSHKGKVILLYSERCSLRQDIFNWLKECGLERKDIYWIPLFTYLELELLGIEQEYKKLVSAGGR